MEIRERQLPEGNAGARVTLERMRDLIQTSRLVPDAAALGFSAELIDEAGRPSSSLTERAVWAYWWVRQTVVFEDDAPGVEEIRSPGVLLEEIRRTGMAHGDCDDLVILLGALLRTLEAPVRLVAVSLQSDGLMEHVYLDAEVEGGWLPLDPSVLESPGWAPLDATARMEVWV